MYTQSSGCNITTPEENAIWEVLCLQYPNAAPFRNCGWDIYEDVKKLCPNKAKGTHSFYPSDGTQGIQDPTSTEGTSMDPSMDLEHRFTPDLDLVPLPVEGASYNSAEPTEVCGLFYCLTYYSQGFRTLHQSLFW